MYPFVRGVRGGLVLTLSAPKNVLTAKPNRPANETYPLRRWCTASAAAWSPIGAVDLCGILFRSGRRLRAAVNQLGETPPETQRNVNQTGWNRHRLGLPTLSGSKQRDA